MGWRYVGVWQCMAAVGGYGGTMVQQCTVTGCVLCCMQHMAVAVGSGQQQGNMVAAAHAQSESLGPSPKPQGAGPKTWGLGLGA